MDNLLLNKAQDATDYILKKFKGKFPEVAVILGSGLGDFIDIVKIIETIPYKNIPGFFTTHVEGHIGNLTIAEIENGKLVLIMQGRYHFYEGYTPMQVAFPVTVFHLLGIKHLIVSNACGGINPNFQVGDLMIINDHINFTGNHPLIGKNNPIIGPRFVDLTEPYSLELIDLAQKVAISSDIKPQIGTYLGVSGPTYETKAEIKAFGILGADVVGMSTIYEVIMANYFNIKVLGISSITNMATGIAKEKHNHSDIVNEAHHISTKFSRWVKNIILAI